MKRFKKFKLVKVITRGVGLTIKQQFEALSSKGEDKEFINECFICFAVKNKVNGFELLSKDFKYKIFVEKDKVVKFIILADDLKALNSSKKVA